MCKVLVYFATNKQDYKKGKKIKKKKKLRDWERCGVDGSEINAIFEERLNYYD